MKPEIDRYLLASDVAAWMKRHALTTRGASAAFPGLNPAMLSRATSMHVLSAASLLALCRAMAVDPMRYLLPPNRPDNQSVTAIGARETGEARP